MSLTISPARIVEESNSPLLAAAEGWVRRPLGDVASILNGYAFKSALFSANGGKPLIRIRDIFGGSTAVGYQGDYDDRYLVQPGDLLVGMDGNFNSARWKGPEALLNQRVCKVVPDPHLLDLDFLTAILPGYLKAIHDQTSSTTVTHLSSRDVAQIPIPVPVLEEQRRIASSIRGTEEARSSASAHLASGRRLVERFRQAVLAAACTGRLSADWRDSMPASAAGLVDELRAAASARRRPVAPPDASLAVECPEGWGLVTLDLLVERIEAGKSFNALGRPARADEWGVVKVSAMSWGRFLQDENKAIPSGLSVDPTNEIRSGDLLISRANTADLVGASVLVADTRTQLLLSDKSLRLITRAGVDKSWLNLILRSPAIRRQFADRATGTSDSMRNLSQPKILATTLSLPPPDEQHEIAHRAEQLMALADVLLQRIDTAHRRIDRSSQAVLAKAFRGELMSPMATAQG